ncbi:MAG: Gfo/Idh/MocA family oxidoreductase [Candidatus Nealsonbacteria bacterium]|nr:Gfo/Idh/MocA family oxidoreductase [Candidatus Nealsonbacteria bacterium]
MRKLTSVSAVGGTRLDDGKYTRGKRAISRRRFLGGVAATTALTIVPRHVCGGPGHIPPSEKTVLACIGMGGQGHVDLFNLLRLDELQVAAVCDVNREGGGYISWDWMQGKEQKLGGCEPARRLVNEHYAKQKNLGKYRGCQAHVDYREMLDKEDVDAVIVATPDHTHATIAMAAIRRGMHVYCEKPLAYSVAEVRQITQAARRKGVATQLGNQGQASEEARVVQEFILDDAIGPVREVHVTVGPPFWDAPASGGPPPETPPVPAGFDWDLWLGPAPVRPYHPAYHPWRWRDWQDFGTGPLGDMGCHKLSTVFKALKLEYPIRVEATCTEIGPEIYPRRFEVRWEFPERDGKPPVTLTWHGGGLQPPRPEQLESDRPVRGDVYIGDKGTLMGNRLVPESRMKSYRRPPKVLARSPGQYKEWVDACRGGPAAGSDFVRHSGPLTETPLLGNIAMRVGRKLEWDGPKMKFTNDEMANRLLRRAYRPGWAL